MNRKDIILHLWDTAYDIEGWYPPLKHALGDLRHEAALWRADPQAHNIWELLNHLVCYKDRFVCRLDGKVFEPSITDNESTFQRGMGTTEDAWQQRIEHLTTVQRTVRERILTLSDADLDAPLPDEPVGGQLLSLISHDGYHTGQIVFIRKLQRSWPGTRAV